MTSYGSGAGSDSFDITVTDKIFYAREKAKAVQSYIDEKIYIDYTRYLSHTGKLR